jgi:integrase
MIDAMVLVLVYFGSQSLSSGHSSGELGRRCVIQQRGEGSCIVIESAWRLTPEKVLTRSEVQQILAAAKQRSLRDYLFFCVAANTGLRLCEVIHLRREDVVQGQLRITRRKKKKLRPEVIDIREDLYAMLVKWAAYKPGWLFPGAQKACQIKHLNGETETVCSGWHVSRRNMQHRWSVHVRAVGLSMHGRGIHTLRHYAISEFYDKHRDLRAAQLYAGHSSPAITTTYAHVREMAAKVKAVEVTL